MIERFYSSNLTAEMNIEMLQSKRSKVGWEQKHSFYPRSNQPNIYAFVYFIQVDAAINPGISRSA
jgi:hypothetical protein